MDGLRPHADPHADLYQRQPAEVEVGCFMDAGRIEPTTKDRHLPPTEVHGHRPAVHSEDGCQFDERRVLAVLSHQIVDLFGAQQV